MTAGDEIVHAYRLINFVYTVAYAHGDKSVIFLVLLHVGKQFAVLLAHILYLYAVYLAKP